MTKVIWSRGGESWLLNAGGSGTHPIQLTESPSNDRFMFEGFSMKWGATQSAPSNKPH